MKKYLIYSLQNFDNTPFTAGSRVGYRLNDPTLPQYAKYFFESSEDINSLSIDLIENFPEKVKDYLLQNNLDYFQIVEFIKYSECSLIQLINFYNLHEECSLLNEI